jgi:predicted DNA-binding protein
MSRSKSDRSRVKTCGIALRGDQIEKIEALAAAQDRSTSYIIREIIDRHLAAEGK